MLILQHLQSAVFAARIRFYRYRAANYFFPFGQSTFMQLHKRLIGLLYNILRFCTEIQTIPSNAKSYEDKRTMMNIYVRLYL